MIYNLDILLPLDTLGALPVLLFLVSGSTPGRLIFCQWKCLLYTGCPKKNAHLSLEANISGLKKPIGKSKTSFENYMFLAFI